jgi:hypothetical protein
VSAVELVAGVVSAFFAIGIAVGVIGVVALGAIRARRKTPDQARTDRTLARLPGPDDEEDEHGPPRWPGQLDGLSARGD